MMTYKKSYLEFIKPNNKKAPFKVLFYWINYPQYHSALRAKIDSLLFNFAE